MLTVRGAAALVETLAPRRLALPQDPGGLQAGDPAARVSRLMVALDASPSTVRQAARARCQLLVTHHPLIYRPLPSVDPSSGPGEALALALSRGVAVYSAHTNLDAAPGGMNAHLASLLGLEPLGVLEPSPSRLAKVVVFVPAPALDAVREALLSSGAGHIGGYDRCSFAAEGEGTFRPGPGTRPAVGKRGKTASVLEARLEAVVEEGRLPAALASVRAAHPYQEPAVDVIPLAGTARAEGVGVWGDLPRPLPASEVVDALAAALRLPWVRTAGNLSARVRRVAACTGSGASLLPAALAAGAGLYVTGDVGYHAARQAEEAGAALADIGHFPPERLGMELFARSLRKALAAAGERAEVVMAREGDPFALRMPVKTTARRR